MATANLAMAQGESKERGADATNEEEGAKDKDGVNKEDEWVKVKGA